MQILHAHPFRISGLTTVFRCMGRLNPKETFKRVEEISISVLEGKEIAPLHAPRGTYNDRSTGHLKALFATNFCYKVSNFDTTSNFHDCVR